MGFGWLFLGYFTVSFLTMNPLGSLIRMIGYGIILASAVKLRRYQRAFDWTLIAAAVMLGIATCLAVVDGTNLLYQYLLIPRQLFPETVRTVIGYVDLGASLVFHALLLWGIRRIALETEVKKIAVNAVRNFVFICIYYVLYGICFLPIPVIQAARSSYVAAAWIVWLVWVILNHVLIFSCYSWICDENDQDMAQKPSRFAFVNRFREENQRRRQKAQEEADAYRREKAEKRKQQGKRRKK